MESIAEMEKRLETAKKLEEARKKELEERTEALVGRAFIDFSGHPNTRSRPGWKHAHMFHVEKLELSGYSPEILWTGREISINAGSEHHWGFSLSKPRKARAGRRILYPEHEISLDVFKAAVSYSKTASESALSYLKDLHKSGSALDKLDDYREPRKAAKGAVKLDIPHIVLEKGEITVLGNTSFTVDYDKYLITPGSLVLAESLVKDAYNFLHRGSGMFQECDMGYVNGQNGMLEGLRQKLREMKTQALPS